MKPLQILSVLFTLVYVHAIPSLCANQFEWTVYFGRSQPFSPDQLVHHMQVAEAIIRDHVCPYALPFLAFALLTIHIRVKLTRIPKGRLNHCPMDTRIPLFSHPGSNK
jgi:hypothetical protein